MKNARRWTACSVVALVLLTVAIGCGGRQSDWEAARKADTAEAYTQFLQRYPDGDFAAQAHARLADLKEEADWKAALAADNAQGYQQFLAQHAQGARADEARIRIENFNLAQAPAEAPAAAASATAAVAPPRATTKPQSKNAAAAPKPVLPAAVGQSGKYRVQLGAFSSASRARSEWQHVVKAHPTQLSGLSYAIDKTSSANGTLYRLQTSSVTEAKAREICAALKTAKQPCVVVVP